MVDCFLQYIQDLDRQPNVTKRGFDPFIMEEYMDLVDGTSVKTTGEMTPFRYYD